MLKLSDFLKLCPHKDPLFENFILSQRLHYKESPYILTVMAPAVEKSTFYSGRFTESRSKKPEYAYFMPDETVLTDRRSQQKEETFYTAIHESGYILATHKIGSYYEEDTTALMQSDIADAWLNTLCLNFTKLSQNEQRYFKIGELLSNYVMFNIHTCIVNAQNMYQAIDEKHADYVDLDKSILKLPVSYKQISALSLNLIYLVMNKSEASGLELIAKKLQALSKLSGNTPLNASQCQDMVAAKLKSLAKPE